MAELLQCSGGGVKGSAPHARLLAYLSSDFCKETGTSLTRHWIYWLDSTAEEYFEVTLISLEDWDAFRAYCYKRGIDVRVKHKMIDGFKIWWPSTIAINVEQDNEYWVWLKLTEY
jgi:hypothetical protein